MHSANTNLTAKSGSMESSNSFVSRRTEPLSAVQREREGKTLPLLVSSLANCVFSIRYGNSWGKLRAGSARWIDLLLCIEMVVFSVALALAFPVKGKSDLKGIAATLEKTRVELSWAKHMDADLKAFYTVVLASPFYQMHLMLFSFQLMSSFFLMQRRICWRNPW